MTTSKNEGGSSFYQGNKRLPRPFLSTIQNEHRRPPISRSSKPHAGPRPEVAHPCHRSPRPPTHGRRHQPDSGLDGGTHFQGSRRRDDLGLLDLSAHHLHASIRELV